VTLRRVNDAQVERLLDAMRRDPKYRSELAKRAVAKEGLTPGTADYARRYKSTMRRFQRYVTEAAEKRSLARAPKQYQRETRQLGRAIAEAPPPRPPVRERLPEYDLAPDEYEPIDRTRDISEYDLPTLEQTARAYHDGDIEETVRALGLSERGADLLDLATTGEGVDIEGMRGAGEIRDGLADWLDTLSGPDIEDVRTFHDLLMGLPDWQIGMIIDDLAFGATTFADWMDAYRNDNYEIYDVSDSEYWKLWRAAYARTKG
jgi:hypothetical protein